MVEYLAGKRVKGTSSERTTLQNPILGGTGVGGWVELGRTASATSPITVSSLPNKRYYMVLFDHTHSTTQHGAVWTLNSDTGSNYATRYSDEGGADTTATSQTSIRVGHGGETNYGKFDVGYIANYSSKEKLLQIQSSNTSTRAASTAPLRTETVSKWGNTSNAIDTITATKVGTGDFASGDEMVVLGWDPADSHTNNFWEELASVNATGSSSNLSSGTITAKKYLWIQIWLDPSTRQNHLLRFNNDTGNNYATRYSTNGATDSTDGSVTNFNLGSGIGTSDGLPSFQNIFVINNSSKEKLAIIHSVWQNTAGAGNATGRIEMVGKWANTASQITEIDIDSSANWNSGSIIKVWGAN